MKMLTERMTASNIIMQEHEIQFRAEKVWRDMKKARINLDFKAPEAIMEEKQRPNVAN